MAGTRLIIQATLLLELVILVLIAAFFGLCHRNNDVLCTPILSQGGRSSIVLPSKWQEKRVIERTEDESNSLRRYNMHVALVLEDGSEWSEWAPAMDDVLSLKNLVNLPCLKGPIKTEISLQGSLSEKTRTVVNNANNTTEYRISGSVVKRWLTARRNTFDESRLDLLLYVPVLSKSPLMVKLKDMQPTTALVWEQQLLSIVERNGDDASSSNKRLAMENAMAYVDPFLKDECQLSSNTTEWWQQLVHDTQERAKDSVLINHKILSKSSLKVPITNEVAERWRRSMQLVDEAMQLAEQGNHLDAVEYLDKSLSISQSLLTDPTLMEPIDMQNDHYMAVFFPLLFPLLLPFMAGLIREVKRYRKLTNKEQKSKAD